MPKRTRSQLQQSEPKKADGAAADQGVSSDEEEARPVRKKAARAGTAAAGKQLQNKAQPSKGRKPIDRSTGVSQHTRKTKKLQHADTEESSDNSTGQAEASESEYTSSSDEEEEEEWTASKKNNNRAWAPARKKKGPRIGRWRAIRTYCLDESDLAKMKDVKTTYNNLFGGYNKTYSSKELEAYARAKHAGSKESKLMLKQSMHKEAHRMERKQTSRTKDTAVALAAVTQYTAPNNAIEVEQYGETKLPDSVLANVMVCLAKTREPGGLRGFACVAKDLANTSLANWDIYRAARALQHWQTMPSRRPTHPRLVISTAPMPHT